MLEKDAIAVRNTMESCEVVTCIAPTVLGPIGTKACRTTDSAMQPGAPNPLQRTR